MSQYLGSFQSHKKIFIVWIYITGLYLLFYAPGKGTFICRIIENAKLYLASIDTLIISSDEGVSSSTGPTKVDLF